MDTPELCKQLFWPHFQAEFIYPLYFQGSHEGEAGSSPEHEGGHQPGDLPTTDSGQAWHYPSPQAAGKDFMRPFLTEQEASSGSPFGAGTAADGRAPGKDSFCSTEPLGDSGIHPGSSGSCWEGGADPRDTGASLKPYPWLQVEDQLHLPASRGSQTRCNYPSRLSYVTDLLFVNRSWHLLRGFSRGFAKVPL